MWEPKNQYPNISEEDKKKEDAEITALKEDLLSSRGQDSGIISDQIFSSELIDEPSSQQSEPASFKQQINIHPDSGCIDVQYDDNLLSSKEHNKQQEAEMILDSGIVCEMSDRLSNLSLKQSINNLGAASKNIIKPNITVSNFSKVQPQPSRTWELYYQQNDEGNTQLHLAIICGMKEVVFKLISLAPLPCLLDIQNDSFQAPLHLAVLANQPHIVRKLLFAGAEATVQDRYGNSPLHLASVNGNLACARALTEPITQEELNERPTIKTLYGDLGCICPPDLEQRNYDGEVCVHLATHNNHIDVLRHLIYSGADINAREGKSGNTPLHLAIEEGKGFVAKFLLEECIEKLRLETVTYAGLTAYQLAALVENKEMISNLMTQGAEPLSPPESDDESDFDDNMMDRYNNAAQTLFRPFNGANAINVS